MLRAFGVDRIFRRRILSVCAGIQRHVQMRIAGREMTPGGARIARRPQELPHLDPLADFQVGQFVEMLVLGIQSDIQAGVFGGVAKVDLVADQPPADIFVDHLSIGDGDDGGKDTDDGDDENE